MLIRQAYLGLPLMETDSERDPDDVVILHDALISKEKTLNLGNCGTAVRFLTAYFAQKEGVHKVLDGCERMHHRPLGQLVDALRELGADIKYLGEEGFLPIEIHGRNLPHISPNHLRDATISNGEGSFPIPNIEYPLSTQFISAMMLVDLPVETSIESPYIDLTRGVVDGTIGMERDWSSAAFWLERWALKLCEKPEFPELNPDSTQGDRICQTYFEQIREMKHGQGLDIDFTQCPDLYPSIAIACAVKGINLNATGTQSLPLKECDRLEAIEHIIRQIGTHGEVPVFQSRGDHRIAMALLAANLPCEDTDCIAKSYPQFVAQLTVNK